ESARIDTASTAMAATTDLSWDDLKAMIAALAEQSRETDRQLRELKRQIGGLGDKFGYFAEGMALPTMEKLLRRRFHM
ncbi:hypothetical protein NET02_16375, partial [Thermomicrobiaceae bacterium CFH 74404]